MLVVFGPTASGKTGLGVKLAQAFNGVVINADSRQIYRQMPIITAMPTPEEQAAAPHLLYDFLEPDAPYSAKHYISDATNAVQHVQAQGKLPIVLGGTGFYIKTLLEGLSPVPDVHAETVQALNKRAEEEGIAPLYAELKRCDPETAAEVKPADAQRIIRALSVYETTGKPLSYYQKLPKQDALSVTPYYIALNPERERLIARINKRFDIMLEEGLEQEIRALYDKGYDCTLPSLTSIGVPIFFDSFEGRTTWQNACDVTCTHMRQYAKRQRTWFRNQYPADIVLENADTEWHRVEEAVSRFLA